MLFRSKQVGALTNWKTVSVGTNSFLAIKTDGTLWGWGYNANDGQLGFGNRTNYSSPKQVGTLTNWAKVVFGTYQSNTFAIKTDGTLWAWGYNYKGVLGLGNTTYYSSPVQVGTLTNWASVSSGGIHTLAIKSDGTLWGWGAGTYDDLGLGNATNYSSPKQIGSLTNWQQVSCGYENTNALQFVGYQ